MYLPKTSAKARRDMKYIFSMSWKWHLCCLGLSLISRDLSVVCVVELAYSYPAGENGDEALTEKLRMFWSFRSARAMEEVLVAGDSEPRRENKRIWM